MNIRLINPGGTKIPKPKIIVLNDIKAVRMIGIRETLQNVPKPPMMIQVGNFTSLEGIVEYGKVGIIERIGLGIDIGPNCPWGRNELWVLNFMQFAGALLKALSLEPKEEEKENLEGETENEVS